MWLCQDLQVKCYAGRVKVLTICVVLFQFTATQRKAGTWRASNLFGDFTPLKRRSFSMWPRKRNTCINRQKWVKFWNWFNQTPSLFLFLFGTIFTYQNTWPKDAANNIVISGPTWEVPHCLLSHQHWSKHPYQIGHHLTCSPWYLENRIKQAVSFKKDNWQRHTRMEKCLWPEQAKFNFACSDQ